MNATSEDKRSAGGFDVAELQQQLKTLAQYKKDLYAGKYGAGADLATSFGGVSAFFFGKDPAAEIDRQMSDIQAQIDKQMHETEARFRQGGAQVGAASKAAVQQAYDPLSSIKTPTIKAPTPDIQGTNSAFAQMRAAIAKGFGSVKAALENPPQNISRDNRIENMETRYKKVMQNLAKSVKTDDPVNIKYWTQAALAQGKRLDAMRNNGTSSVNATKKKFKELGVTIPAQWEKVSASAKKESEAASSSAQGVVDDIEAMDLTGAGTNLMTTWGAGIDAGTPAAVAAAERAAAAVAAVTVGGSPPPKGPLHKIDQGGANIITAWAGGLRSGIGKVASAGDAVARAFDPSLSSPSMALAGARAAPSVAASRTSTTSRPMGPPCARILRQRSWPRSVGPPAWEP